MKPVKIKNPQTVLHAIEGFDLAHQKAVNQLRQDQSEQGYQCFQSGTLMKSTSGKAFRVLAKDESRNPRGCWSIPASHFRQYAKTWYDNPNRRFYFYLAEHQQKVSIEQVLLFDPPVYGNRDRIENGREYFLIAPCWQLLQVKPSLVPINQVLNEFPNLVQRHRSIYRRYGYRV